MLKLKFSTVILITAILSIQMANAKDKVVVVPMQGDDVALAQQHEVVSGSGIASGGTANICETDVYRTPAQPVQVYASFISMALLAATEQFYRLNFEYKKAGDSNYSLGRPNAFAGGAANTWIQAQNVNVVDLDPSSDYQFRVSVTSLPTGAGTVWCRLALTFSFKLPNGKTIVEKL